MATKIKSIYSVKDDKNIIRWAHMVLFCLFIRIMVEMGQHQFI